MLKRKFLDRLQEWKKNPLKKPLLVKGARQVGKTYLIDHFARENYRHYLYLNFLQDESLGRIFDGDLSADAILSRLSLRFREAVFEPGETIVFLDEIQECGQARTALKFLCGDPRLDVIASGSLLGIQYKPVKSIPVGYEEPVVMHSLDFEEFLWAKGYSEDQISQLKGCFERREKVDEFVNATFHEEIREYIIVGGMPEVVDLYVAHRNYGEVDSAQRRILSDYMADIMNYAPPMEKTKVRNCFLSIPRQLARETENRKFKYAEVEKGVGSRKYGNSVEWLRDASIADMAVNLTAPLFPLSAYIDDEVFKLYVSDIGLLTAMYGFETKAAVREQRISGSMKGALYENLIATFLIRGGYELRYQRETNRPLEVEFLIEKNGCVVPIEVKASNDATASLNRMLERAEIPMGYKLIAGNVGVSGKKVTLPHYMAMFI